MTEEDFRMIGTDLKCSRCQATIVTYPGDFTDPAGSISNALARDLLRQVAVHCFHCPGRAA